MLGMGLVSVFLQTGRLYEAYRSFIIPCSTNRLPLRGSYIIYNAWFYKQAAFTMLGMGLVSVFLETDRSYGPANNLDIFREPQTHPVYKNNP